MLKAEAALSQPVEGVRRDPELKRLEDSLPDIAELCTDLTDRRKQASDDVALIVRIVDDTPTSIVALSEQPLIEPKRVAAACRRSRRRA
jgi:hypothetical protein